MDKPRSHYLQRQTAMRLHVPQDEWDKPEMRAFVEGRDVRSRPHLEATAQALTEAWAAGAEKERGRVKKQLEAAKRLYMVFGMLGFWACEDLRSIQWGRFKKAGKRDFKKAEDYGCTVWAMEGDRMIANAQGDDAPQAAERLAVKLKLVEPGELL